VSSLRNILILSPNTILPPSCRLHPTASGYFSWVYLRMNINNSAWELWFNALAVADEISRIIRKRSVYYRLHNSRLSQRALFVCALNSWVHFTKQNWCLFCRKRTKCLSESQNNSIHFMTYRRTNAMPIKSSMNACINTHTQKT